MVLMLLNILKTLKSSGQAPMVSSIAYIICLILLKGLQMHTSFLILRNRTTVRECPISLDNKSIRTLYCCNFIQQLDDTLSCISVHRSFCAQKKKIVIKRLHLKFSTVSLKYLRGSKNALQNQPVDTKVTA
jgi:hypothetical protein